VNCLPARGRVNRETCAATSTKQIFAPIFMPARTTDHPRCFRSRRRNSASFLPHFSGCGRGRIGPPAGSGLQFPKQFQNRFLALFRRIREIHLGPPSHVSRQDVIEEGVQFGTRQRVVVRLVRVWHSVLPGAIFPIIALPAGEVVKPGTPWKFALASHSINRTLCDTRVQTDRVALPAGW
jgi:hypothetical protein